MRKIIALLVPIIIAVSVLGVVVWLERGRPADWQQALSSYLTESAPTTGAATVRLIKPARTPWNFPLDTTKPVYADWPLSAVELPPASQIQCVWLERRWLAADTERNRRREEVVLVVYHSDWLWNQGWVVHQLRDDSPASVADVLAAVGCE